VFAPTHPDLSKVHIRAGEYHEGELSECMSQDKITADVVATWLKLADGRPTLCFAVDRAHAKHLQQRFEAAGVPCGYVDMLTPRHEREDTKQKLARGEYKVVSNIATLTTGVDWDVRCISLVRPTKSEMLFVQIIGRGLRTAPGKDHCLILDHSDNHLRMGFVSDIVHEHLSDGSTPTTADKAIALPKECPQCHMLKPPRTAVCLNCGHKVEAHAAAPRAEAPGELGEFTGKISRAKPTFDQIFKKDQVYGMLKFICSERGYNPGWASNKFRELYGVWPNHYKDAPLMVPVPAIRSWIKSTQIAWARSKRNPVNGKEVVCNGPTPKHNPVPAQNTGAGRAFLPGTLMTAEDWEVEL
jgi:DNA repair protein RadD